MVSTSSLISLDSLLQQIARELQLPDYLDERVRKHYESLAAFLDTSTLAPYRPKLYAQGSFRIGTTVRPLSNPGGNEEEFDLDFVCELQLSPLLGAEYIYSLVASVIEASELYGKKSERLPRCIRIHFDECHVDIVPAVPFQEGSEAIYIPDKDGDNWSWHSTNPKGYARWFLERSESRAGAYSMKVRASIEPLPTQQPVSAKSALQVGVQLAKRNHQLLVADIHLRTPSIVFTTVAGEDCSGQAMVVATFSNLVRVLRDEYAIFEGPRHVNHPAHPECISEKWNKRPVYQTFRSYVSDMDRQWKAVLTAEGQSMDALAAALNTMFGERPVKVAMKSIADRAHHLTDNRQIKTAAGGGLVVTQPGLGNPRKNFYGD